MGCGQRKHHEQLFVVAFLASEIPNQRLEISSLFLGFFLGFSRMGGNEGMGWRGGGSGSRSDAARGDVMDVLLGEAQRADLGGNKR